MFPSSGHEINVRRFFIRRGWLGPNPGGTAVHFRSLGETPKGRKGHNLSSSIVKKYGSYLRPSLYEHLNLKPMTRQQALKAEEKLAWDLRRQGYAVWFN
jgi:hypothetical protein